MTFKIKHALCIIACWITPPLLAQSETTKYPTWLFGIDVKATPNKPFTESLMDFYLHYSQFQSRMTITQNSVKAYTAEDSFDAKLGLDYMTLIQDGRICLGFGAAIQSYEYATSYYAPGIRRSAGKYSILDISTTPISGTISIKPQPGFWVGLRNEWLPEDRTYATDQFSASSTESSQSTEYNKKTLGLQLVSYPMHAGLEYTVTNKSDQVETDLTLPIRVAMSEKLFVGAKLKVQESEFIDSDLHEATSGSTAELGYQGESSAYAVKFDYDINKSGLASSVTQTKTKKGWFEVAFGKPQGLRYRFSTGYLYELSRNSSSIRGRKEGGIFKIDVSRVY